ncbi:hypothetical protein QEV83_10300 [Methylocapsa sp. D3K7]|uniref:hypothetical protein n=1 Tax=Methylocapsa sp. D3K7 TaxID=3041435 RepID=UPI00244EE452|nr:hypothetical protein [Methylocapsa sp. D3K7]WGJ13121.1 hypothetical protein QEV83_10300 [Methylocapsa sp. D3K7]
MRKPWAASGYLALMGLAGLDPSVMRSTSLDLNIAVALIGTVQRGLAAAVTAAYNLLNSVGALVGAYATLRSLPPALPWWLVAAAIEVML